VSICGPLIIEEPDVKNTQQPEFDDKKFPKIKLLDNHFEIKAIDYWEYRSFNNSNVIEIEYAPVKIWWGLMDKIAPIQRYMWYGKKHCMLKIILKNDVVWDYKVLGEYSTEYARLVGDLIESVGLQRE
jgi:hypothetical protein